MQPLPENSENGSATTTTKEVYKVIVPQTKKPNNFIEQENWLNTTKQNLWLWILTKDPGCQNIPQLYVWPGLISQRV